MKKFTSIGFIFLQAILLAQGTVFQPGEIIILGINTNNNVCSGATNGEDLIYLVAFKDITTGTVLDFTDNGWEREYANFFGTTEGVYSYTRSGGTISAGTIFTFSFPETGANNPGWTFQNLSTGTLNMNTGGDQLFLMQGGNWTETGVTHQGSYSGVLLYGFNTKTTWNAVANTTKDSALPVSLDCYNTTATTSASDYIYYNGPLTATTQSDWLFRTNTDGNWMQVSDCNAFNSSFNLSQIPFLDTFIDQPMDLVLCQNDIAMELSINTNGGPYTYQWYQNSSNQYDGATAIPGANSSSYTPPTNIVSTNYYYVELIESGSCAIRSNIAMVNINLQPITTVISYN